MIILALLCLMLILLIIFIILNNAEELTEAILDAFDLGVELFQKLLRIDVSKYGEDGEK